MSKPAGPVRIVLRCIRPFAGLVVMRGHVDSLG